MHKENILWKELEIGPDEASEVLVCSDALKSLFNISGRAQCRDETINDLESDVLRYQVWKPSSTDPTIKQISCSSRVLRHLYSNIMKLGRILPPYLSRERDARSRVSTAMAGGRMVLK